MLWTPNQGKCRTITNYGIVGSATPGTGVPSNATTLLDGAVTEVISAANNVFDSWGIEIVITNTGANATAAEACMDILIGGATDDILIASLICGYAVGAAQAASFGYRYFFPLHIPQGKRIAAVLASVRVSITSQVMITLLGNSPSPFRTARKITTLGTQINNARGQAIVPTASGGAASVTELIASTADDYFALLPGFQPATDTTLTPAGFVNIGIGVGAATVDRVGTWFFGKSTGESCEGPVPFLPAFGQFPTGSRITMLASNSGGNDAAYDGLIYALS